MHQPVNTTFMRKHLIVIYFSIFKCSFWNTESFLLERQHRTKSHRSQEQSTNKMDLNHIPMLNLGGPTICLARQPHRHFLMDKMGEGKLILPTTTNSVSTLSDDDDSKPSQPLPNAPATTTGNRTNATQEPWPHSLLTLLVHEFGFRLHYWWSFYFCCRNTIVPECVEVVFHCDIDKPLLCSCCLTFLWSTVQFSLCIGFYFVFWPDMSCLLCLLDHSFRCLNMVN